MKMEVKSFESTPEDKIIRAVEVALTRSGFSLPAVNHSTITPHLRGSDFLGVRRACDALRFEMERNNFRDALSAWQQNKHIHRFPHLRNFVEGALYLHLNEYEDAKACFKKYETAGRYLELDVPPCIFQDSSITRGNIELRRPARKPFKELGNVVVYSSMFGKYDTIPPRLLPSSARFIMITDQDNLLAPGWEIRREKRTSEDGNRAAKYYKINPHIEFPEFEYSLFVDACSFFCGDVDAFVNDWLLESDFAMFRHDKTSSIITEATTIIALGYDDIELVIDTVQAGVEAGVNSATPLAAGSFIWRRHNSPESIEFSEHWWRAIQAGSKRDQLSFGHAVEATGIQPAFLPASLGTAPNNILLWRESHSPDHRAPAKVTEKPKIALIFAAHTVQYGSVQMRTFQLAEILRRHSCYGDCISILSENELSNLENTICIFSKHAIGVSRTHAKALRSRNNLVVLDIVDARYSIDEADQSDAVIVTSMSAYKNLKNIKRGVYFISHHADLRLHGAPPGEYNDRIGYFGEPQNGVLTSGIRALVDVIPIDTSRSTGDWLEQTQKYPLHYAVRLPRSIDGYKPFTKGFVAAKCGVPIICPRFEEDNEIWLGADYPYYVEALDEPSIVRACNYALATLHQDDWLYAQQIMQRLARANSEPAIANQFDMMVVSLARMHVE